jgi:hypothetical protein
MTLANSILASADIRTNLHAWLVAQGVPLELAHRATLEAAPVMARSLRTAIDGWGTRLLQVCEQQAKDGAQG